jgi:hypothetical protein
MQKMYRSSETNSTVVVESNDARPAGVARMSWQTQNRSSERQNFTTMVFSEPETHRDAY